MAVTGSGYQAWVTFLDRWRAGQADDARELPLLAEQDYPADSWSRLIRRMTEVLASRLRAWADGLLRAMAEARDEFEVARALTQSRQGLAVIRAVAAHPGLPPQLSRQLLDAVNEAISAAQQALLDNIESARRAGVDDRIVQARLRTLRDNPITVHTATAPRRTDAWSCDPSRPPRRQILIDPPPLRPEE
ncbi:hypothetical protein [Micromonospora sp. NPDC049175]|uniref:hypothetical protein n=1 Tax=unclassified Micromonospora TaxID=2617518 RepID=UPI0037156BA8